MADEAPPNSSWKQNPLLSQLGTFADGHVPQKPRLPRAPDFQIDLLKDFAAKRGMPVDVIGWENAVLFVAASEHPELTVSRKPRGRPKFKWTPLRALLGLSDSDSRKRIEDLFVWVEEYRLANETDLGKHPTVRECIRAHIEIVEGIPRETFDFEDRVQVREAEFYAARRRLKGLKRAGKT